MHPDEQPMTKTRKKKARAEGDREMCASPALKSGPERDEPDLEVAAGTDVTLKLLII